MRPIGRQFSACFLLLVLSIGLVGITPSAEAAVIRPFGVRFTRNTTGAVMMTGNTILTCPASASGCTAARTGTASTLAANNNNNFAMTFVDIDGDPSTFDSSRNTLTVPSTSTVLFAGLYWGADTTAGTSGTAAPDASARGQVLLRTPGSAGYLPISASQVDTSPVAGGVRYQGFADVTSLVSASRSGEYTVANLQAGRGADRYGGWALVVALQDPTEPLRNLTVFDGYAVVQQTPTSDRNVAVPVSGFVTPQSGPVRSRIGVVTYEGDLGLTGDSLRLNATSLTNSLNPATNFFNSSLTGFDSTNTTGDPFQTNMMGFDIDTINANGILANNATSATINLNTTNDTYFPGVVSFSTELFSPRLDLEKSGIDVDGGPLDVGDEVLYTIRVTNNGDDGASNVVVSDRIPDNATYVNGSLMVDGVAVTDAAGDDIGELATGPSRIVTRLGAGANQSTGGSLPVGASRTLSFRVTVGTVPVDQALTNIATATYTGSTSGLPIEGSSNPVLLTPRQRSDLSVLKSGPTDRVTTPGSASFRLVVINNGPAQEPAAVVTDTLPAGFVAVSATASQGTCSGATTVTCNLGSLGVGDSAFVDIDATVASGSGTVTNTVTVSGANLDLFPNNDNASASVALNRPPVAIDHTASTTESTAVTIPVLTGATDPDGDTITTVGTSPAGNGVVVNSDGTVTYTPVAGFKGSDVFTYTISDGSAFVTANVTVEVANAPPSAVDDVVGTLPATAVTVDVLANDADANGDALAVVAITQPGGGAATGVVVDNGDGTVTFTPNGAFRGTATFTYTISDGTDTSTATVTVSVPDAAPVAVDDSVTTPSATAAIIDVIANDIDDNGDPLSISAITQPGNGTATDNGDGSVTYTPSPTFKGIDTFTYTITDGTSTATATVTVTVSNAAPLSGDDSVNALPGTAVQVDVLANDNDPNGDAISIQALSNPANGVATLGPANIVTYTPNPGFKGTDTFTYTITDGVDSSTATITITVANGAPVGSADRRNTDTDTPVAISVLENDFDPNGDPLVVLSASPPSSGSAVVNGDNTITYTPAGGFKGSDSFTYILSDGTDTANATVTITVANAAPIANDDSASTPADSPVVVPVITNDSDANGDSLSILSVSTPTSGSAVINPNGTVTYTPNTGFKGTDTFTYTVTDGTDTATATVSIAVADASPVAVDDDVATLPATAVAVSVLDNDSDPNGDPLSVTGVTQPVGGAAAGVVVDNGDGTVTFTPSAAFRGRAEFTYSITDGTDSATATVRVTVPDAAPVAIDDTADTAPSTPITISVLDNDLDDNGDPLSVTAVTQPAGGAATGVAVDNGDGTVTFTPSASFRDTAEFTYSITDGTNSASASVRVTVGNTPPNAVPDSANTASGTSVVIDVLDNDSDDNNDPLVVIDTSTPANGTVTLGAGGRLTYNPKPDFKGSDSFTYTISDGTDSAIATVTVTVANAAPIAADDSVATLPATAVVIDVVSNDFDPNGDPLTISAITQPVGGTSTGVAVDNSDGTVTFTPALGFRGVASFTYTVSDGTDIDTATVSVTVPDAGPVAIDDAITTPSATPVNVSVLDNDVDDNGDPLSITTISQPANGTAVNNGDGTVTYNPVGTFKGVDTFTYTITDGTSTDSATVAVTVGNAAPSAVDDQGTTSPSAAVNIDVLANDFDLNADLITVLTLTNPANGSAVVNADGTIGYTPSDGFTGLDSFTYTITDGTDTTSATVTVTVTAAALFNNPPVASPDTAATPAGVAVNIPVLNNDSDPDADPLITVSATQPADGAAVIEADGTISYTPDVGFSGTDTFTYTISDGSNTGTAVVTVTVNSPATVPEPSPNLPEPLAFTGVNTLWLVALGSFLLLVGLALVAQSRRKELRA